MNTRGLRRTWLWLLCFLGVDVPCDSLEALVAWKHAYHWCGQSPVPQGADRSGLRGAYRRQLLGDPKSFFDPSQPEVTPTLEEWRTFSALGGLVSLLKGGRWWKYGGS